MVQAKCYHYYVNHLQLYNTSRCVYKDEPHLNVYRAAHHPHLPLTVSMIYSWTPAVGPVLYTVKHGAEQAHILHSFHLPSLTLEQTWLKHKPEGPRLGRAVTSPLLPPGHASSNCEQSYHFPHLPQAHRTMGVMTGCWLTFYFHSIYFIHMEQWLWSCR